MKLSDSRLKVAPLALNLPIATSNSSKALAPFLTLELARLALVQILHRAVTINNIRQAMDDVGLEVSDCLVLSDFRMVYKRY